MAPVLEILTASCGRYHDLLGRELLKSLGEGMGADKGLEVGGVLGVGGGGGWMDGWTYPSGLPAL